MSKNKCSLKIISFLLTIVLALPILCSCSQEVFFSLFETTSDYLHSSNSIGDEDFPAYYVEHLHNKIYAIDKVKALNKIDYTFAFVTDLHWETNTKISPSLLTNIRMRTVVDKTILGGDYSSYDREDVNESISVMKTCVDSFIYGDYSAILGNHDTNCNLNNGTPSIAPEEAYSIINNRSMSKPFSCDLNYDKKICSLYLYSGTNVGSFDYDGQKDFIYDTISPLDETWFVLFFIHIIYSGSGNNDGLSVLTTAGNDFLDYIESIKGSLKCNLIGAFSGHSHMDLLNNNDYSIPVVTTMCDSIGFYNQASNIYLREKGTFTEQAFDIVQVSLESRKVFLTRIGAGSDRSFSF